MPGCVTGSAGGIAGVKGGNISRKNKRGGINRPGHPVLKLKFEERDRA